VTIAEWAHVNGASADRADGVRAKLGAGDAGGFGGRFAVDTRIFMPLRAIVPECGLSSAMP
jgi:hypothetical protein